MKIKILFKLFSFFVFFFLSSFFNQISAQCWPNDTTPPHSALLKDYDGRGWAFATDGNYNGTVQNPHPWMNDTLNIWSVCKLGPQGGSPGNPPDPTSEVGQVYIQISAGDVVEIENITLKNNVTLVICGHLIVRQEFVIGEEDGENTFNNGKIVICPNGVLDMKIFKVKNSTNIVVDGTFIVDQISGQQDDSGNCISGTGTIVNHDGTSPQPNISEFSYGGDNLNDDCLGGTPILPIDLLSFNSEIRPDRVEFSWTTGSEINNDYFTLERSRDLYGWEVLGFVEGAGNSSVPIDYSFSDLRPLDGLAYYRLKQTDFDGQFKYYGPIAAHYDLGMEGLEFKVMKNFSHWVIAVPQDGVYQVEVYNLEGHRLHSERVENTLSIPAPQGAVVIRVTDGFERSASRVVM